MALRILGTAELNKTKRKEQYNNLLVKETRDPKHLDMIYKLDELRAGYEGGLDPVKVGEIIVSFFDLMTEELLMGYEFQTPIGFFKVREFRRTHRVRIDYRKTLENKREGIDEVVIKELEGMPGRLLWIPKIDNIPFKDFDFVEVKRTRENIPKYTRRRYENLLTKGNDYRL